MSLSPFLRSPFTDLTPYMFTHQWYGRCANFEMKVINCLEAYGLDKGRIKCKDLISDFQECVGRHKEKARNLEMIRERIRQYKAGERTAENKYQKIPPRPDSF
ncbi:NADH dehydrogenase [ubiquinone] iron-sulfur protein 5 [Agrilus planipennis]|uniref:NADH dehydrogenase [ubiquinone] iron-sulfur protein 5 n=1 Tax=Agrilus planipennis TaxID=224129 RepID=A0A1W4XHU9_AGRPL|nr:NADH dehydrogenase [ubiquinone] iron-sulfur protein 5 [Agrilus planipennis]XP_018335701.1 NADH dehydrogenase [ubiquinone] iron-sulfur protein 5 [Agrilus planipennis]